MSDALRDDASKLQRYIAPWFGVPNHLKAALQTWIDGVEARLAELERVVADVPSRLDALERVVDDLHRREHCHPQGGVVEARPPASDARACVRDTQPFPPP